jgi:hypothetical protein
MELPVRPESVRRAREAVTVFRDQLDEPTYNDLRLVVSELVADAVRVEVQGIHDLSVMIEVGDGRTWASVSDGVGAFKLRSRRPELGESGWGIHLARALARRWGTRYEATHCSIWIEMERPARALTDGLLAPRAV